MIVLKRISTLAIILTLFFMAAGCSDDLHIAAEPYSKTLSGSSAIKVPTVLTDPKIVYETQETVTGELTRSQAISFALKKNPELRSFSWDVQIAGAQRIQAGLVPNPEFEFETEGIGGTGERRGFDGAETTFALSQPLELAGKRRKRIKIAEAEQRRMQWDYQAKKLDVYGWASTAFTMVLGSQEKLQLARDRVNLAEKLFDTVTKRVEAGKDSYVESTKAKIELANSRIDLSNTLSGLELARKQLASLWNDTEVSFTKAVGRLDTISSVENFESLKTAALQHPSILRWDDEIASRKAGEELAKAKSTPDISVMGGIKRLGEAEDNTFVLGLVIPIPINDRNQAQRLKASYESAKAIDLKRQSQNDMQKRLAEAYSRLINAYDQADTLQREVLSNAEQAFDAILTGYEQGKFDYLYVLDSQRTLFELKNRIVTTLIDYHQAKTNVETLIGQPLD